MFIYTDGSKIDEYVGATVVSPYGTQQYRLPSVCSNFTAEMYAILEAVKVANQHPQQHFIIATDSLSSLQLCQKSNPRHPLALKIQHEFSQHALDSNKPAFLYVPSHIGIHGNDVADAAARQAALSEATPIALYTHNDVRAHLHHRIIGTYSTEWQTGTSKLKEIKITPVGSLDLPSTRNDQVVINRLRIGHTKATHDYLLARSEAPTCDICHTSITVKHILVDCKKFGEERKKHHLPTTLKEMLGTSLLKLENTIHFLKDIDMYDRI